MPGKVIEIMFFSTILVHQFGQLVMVFVIMACALFGTVGIIKLIKKFFPFIDLPQNLFRTNEKDKNTRNKEDKGHTNMQ